MKNDDDDVMMSGETKKQGVHRRGGLASFVVCDGIGTNLYAGGMVVLWDE